MKLARFFYFTTLNKPSSYRKCKPFIAYLEFPSKKKVDSFVKFVLIKDVITLRYVQNLKTTYFGIKS